MQKIMQSLLILLLYYIVLIKFKFKKNFFFFSNFQSVSMYNLNIRFLKYKNFILKKQIYLTILK